MAARISNPTIKAFEGGVVIVDKLPTSNIKENVIYGVKTYTSDSDFIIKHWRRVKNKWVGFNHTGIVNPLTITTSGTYDVINEPEVVGIDEIVAGARYTYKSQLSKNALKTLYSYANEEGLLHKWSISDGSTNHEIFTKIVKVGSEYILSTNQWFDTMTNSGQCWGQHYATSTVSYNGIEYPAGWSIVGVKINNSFDFSYPVSVEEMSGTLPTVLRVPEELSADYVLGSSEMWTLYKDELLAKQLDLENCYWINGLTELTGMINGTEYVGIDFEATPEVLYNRPIVTINPEVLGDQGNALNAYLMEVLYDFSMFSGFNDKLPMKLTETEDGCLVTLENGYTYIQDLKGLEVAGDIEIGKWYLPVSIVEDFSYGIGFYGYLPADNSQRVAGYNPIIVNVDKRKPEQTKTLSITANGKYKVTPEAGMALVGVNINTNVNAIPKTETTKTVYLYDNNTTTEIVPDTGKTFSKVTINTNVSFPKETRTISANGVVTPRSGSYAMSKVTVNVAPVLQTKVVYENGIVTPDTNYYGLDKVNIRMRPRQSLIPLVEGSGIGELVIPDTLTEIPAYAFYGQGYESVSLPATLETIGEAAFAECNSLLTVYYGGTMSEWSEKGFANNFSDDIIVYCSDEI